MNRIALLALALFALLALAINAIAVSDDWWIVLLTVLAAMAVFTVIGHDVRRLMEQEDDDAGDVAAPAPAPAPAPARGSGAPARPGQDFTGAAGDERVVVVTTGPVAAEDVLPALGLPDAPGRLSIMVVAPEGVGHVNADDERHYVAARKAEGDTVGALRRAGIHAAGHVGDHSPSQAIEDALALFPAPRVVVLTNGADAATLHADVDAVALAGRTGASVEFVDLSPGRRTSG